MATTARHLREVSPPQPHFTKKRWLIYPGLILGLLVALCLVDGIYVTSGLRNSLRTSFQELRRARAAIMDGRVLAAERAAETARREASHALALSRHPSVVIAAFLPKLSAEARAVRALALTADLSAHAISLGVQAARELDLRQESPPEVLLSEGRVRLDALSDILPLLEGIESLLLEGRLVLESLDPPRIGTLNDAYGRARTVLASAAETSERTVTLLRALPSMLGADTPKRYFLAFQTPSEARGTGGLLGTYAILSADRGRLRIRELGPIGTLGNPPTVSTQKWFEANYGRAALSDWRQANSSPNFPAVARVWLAMWKAVRAESLDGVLAMDPVALASLLPATGPLDLAGDAPDIGSDNAVKALLHDSYLSFDDRAQNRYLAEVVLTFWRKISNGEFEPVRFSEGLSEAFRTQHMKLFTVDTEPAEALRALKLDGDLESYGPNIQILFGNNYGVNKVDYFLHRTIATSVEFQPDGSAQVATRIKLVNTAPAGPPSLLLGSDDPGRNGTVLSLLMPEGAHSAAIRVGGSSRPPLDYRDDDNPVTWSAVDVQPGGQTRVQFSYQLPTAYDPARDSSFSLTLIPQPTVIPDRYTITFRPPAGYELRSNELRSLGEGQLFLEGVLSGPVALKVALIRSR